MKRKSLVFLPLIGSLTFLAACTLGYRLDMEIRIEKLLEGSDVSPCFGLFQADGKQAGPVMCDGGAELEEIATGVYSALWEVGTGEAEQMGLEDEGASEYVLKPMLEVEGVLYKAVSFDYESGDGTLSISKFVIDEAHEANGIEFESL